MRLNPDKKPAKRRAPYNKGDAYEKKVVDIMRGRGILPDGFQRAGAGGGADAIFIHGGNEYNLEIKADLKADYGQRYLKWSESDGWSWRVDDEVTALYTGIGVLDLVEGKNIVPKRYTMEKDDITLADKQDDQHAFEDTSIKIDSRALQRFYKKKGTFYIQVGDGCGFYNLDADPARLGTMQFDIDFTLRLRCKTIHSDPMYNYGFLAVLKPASKPEKSKYNIEENPVQGFPPIRP